MKPSALFKFILPEVEGAPDELVRQAIVLTVNDFCQDTHCWNELLDPIPLEDGVNEYTIDRPAGGSVITVHQVMCGPEELRPVTQHELVNVLPDWQTNRSTRPSYYNASSGFGTLKVWPIPTNPGNNSITVRAVYGVDITGDFVPDFLPNSYFDGIISGTKARLMMMPGKKWTNPELAGFHLQALAEEKAKAKVDLFHERVQGSVRARPIRFGGF